MYMCSSFIKQWNPVIEITQITLKSYKFLKLSTWIVLVFQCVKLQFFSSFPVLYRAQLSLLILARVVPYVKFLLILLRLYQMNMFYKECFDHASPSLFHGGNILTLFPHLTGDRIGSKVILPSQNLRTLFILLVCSIVEKVGSCLSTLWITFCLLWELLQCSHCLRGYGISMHVCVDNTSLILFSTQYVTSLYNYFFIPEHFSSNLLFLLFLYFCSSPFRILIKRMMDYVDIFSKPLHSSLRSSVSFCGGSKAVWSLNHVISHWNSIKHHFPGPLCRWLVLANGKLTELPVSFQYKLMWIASGLSHVFFFLHLKADWR